MKVLVIDVGGTNLKVSLGGAEPPLKIPAVLSRPARPVSSFQHSHSKSSSCAKSILESTSAVKGPTICVPLLTSQR